MTLQELALETFFPAEDFTGKVLRQMHAELVSPAAQTGGLFSDAALAPVAPS